MAELSRIAQSIFLGNGEVWNFLNYARGLSIGDIGGLLRYTGAIGAFGNAVNSNLRQGSGVGQRMPASELTYEKSYHILRGAGDSGSRIHETGQAATTTLIGDVYAAERPDASERRFVTQDDFTALGDYAKNKAMQLNRGGMMSYSAMTVSGLTAIGVGDDVTPAMTTEIDDSLAIELDRGLYQYTNNILYGPAGDRRFGQAPKGAMRRVFSPIASDDGPDSGTSMYSPRRPYGYAAETDRQLFTGEDAGGLIDEFFNPTNAADGNSYIPGGTSDGKGLTEYAYDGTGTRVYTYYKELEDRIAGKELGNDTADSMKVTASTAGDTYENGEQSYLLHRTARMFANGIIGSLVNRFHGDVKDSDFLSSYSSLYGISRGRNLLKESFSTDGNGYTNPYCRVWTASHQYARLRDRIRPFISDSGFMKLSDVQAKYGSLRPNGSTESLDKYSVLQPNGFVRITPTERSTSGTIKNYMFSIENLAWKDILRDTETDAVSEEQRGPNGGRIMWFPPYGLNFSENVNVNWVSNSFIGRGEDIHTYVSTVRSGTLDFIIICDHPSVVDKWAEGKTGYDSRNENRLLRFFAGCDDLNGDISETVEEKEEPQREEEPSTDPEPVFHTRKICYVVFFPNNFSGKDDIEDKENMQDVISNVLTLYNEGYDFETNFSDEAYEDQWLQDWNRVADGIDAEEYEDEIRNNLLFGDPDCEIHFCADLDSIHYNFKGGTIYGMPVGTCEIKEVTARGYASSHGYRDANETLANSRAEFVSEWAKWRSDDIRAKGVRIEYPSIIEMNDIDGRKDVNSLDARLARAAVLTVEISWQENNQPTSPPVTDDVSASVEGLSMSGTADGENDAGSERNERTETETVGMDEYTYDNEYLYFKNLEASNPMVWRAIVEKIRHFDPAFHSVTPEGYNARLTFLHQCTRQGPTRSVSGGRTGEGSSDYLKFAGNLSFGRAPYCILRIGDFYNTKICITSLSISYDSGSGVQWDLNPEGTGVQPMFAKVSMTFNFLGGQDLSGPIERLQNAVTANFYANASVYDRHADNGTHYYDAWESGSQARKEKEMKEKKTNS